MVIVIVIVILLAVLFIGGYNSLVKLRNTVEEGFATMDVYLKKRYDLIPNLVETVKGYAKHESEVFEKVTEARAGVQSASSVEEKLKNENALSGTLKTLFAVSEAYPELRANENFLNLQDQLEKIEEDIANARKYYNAVVKEMNNKVEMFPTNIVAGIFGFKRQPMFEAPAEERGNVSVKF